MNAKEIFLLNYNQIEDYVLQWPDEVYRTEDYEDLDFDDLKESGIGQVGSWFQTFWNELPDSPNIRYGAFYKICDIAEEYCFGEES